MEAQSDIKTFNAISTGFNAIPTGFNQFVNAATHIAGKQMDKKSAKSAIMKLVNAMDYHDQCGIVDEICKASKQKTPGKFNPEISVVLQQRWARIMTDLEQCMGAIYETTAQNLVDHAFKRSEPETISFRMNAVAPSQSTDSKRSAETEKTISTTSSIVSDEPSTSKGSGRVVNPAELRMKAANDEQYISWSDMTDADDEFSFTNMHQKTTNARSTAQQSSSIPPGSSANESGRIESEPKNYASAAAKAKDLPAPPPKPKTELRSSDACNTQEELTGQRTKFTAMDCADAGMVKPNPSMKVKTSTQYMFFQNALIYPEEFDSYLHAVDEESMPFGWYKVHNKSEECSLYRTIPVSDVLHVYMKKQNKWIHFNCHHKTDLRKHSVEKLSKMAILSEKDLRMFCVPIALKIYDHEQSKSGYTTVGKKERKAK